MCRKYSVVRNQVVNDTKYFVFSPRTVWKSGEMISDVNDLMLYKVAYLILDRERLNICTSTITTEKII